MYARFLFLSLLLAGIVADRIALETQLKLNVSTPPSKLETGQSANFYFVVPSNFSTGANYLIFDVAGADDAANDPDIYISSVSEWKCTSYGQDLCVVPKEFVRPNGTFYAAVYCAQKCDYQLIVKASAEYELRAGEKITDYLRKSEGRLFRFTVPDDHDIHSISVMLDISGSTSTVRMFVAPASEGMPSAQNTVPVSYSWFGLGMRAYEGKDRYFCRNCEYKVLISSQEGTEYTLVYKTSKSVTKVKGAHFQTYEMIDFDERNCYRLNVKDAKATLEVTLNTFSGDPDIYVNPLSLPKSKPEFAFSSKGSLDEVLSVTPDMRQRLAAATGKYYVCIYGGRPSSYGLIMDVAEKGGNERIMMDSGLTRTMSVDRDELLLFEYIVSDQDGSNITFTLSSLSGNADLYIKYCAVQLSEFGVPTTTCTLTKDNLHDAEVTESEETSATDVITLQYDPKKCQGETRRCSYVIGVLGQEDSSFSLTVLGDSRVETPIAEGKPFFSYVGLRQSLRFTFVVSDPQVTSVKVQLTSLSGDADLFVSRGQPVQDRLNAEKSSMHLAFMPDSVQYTKENDGVLGTSYHVLVYGDTAATFTLTYTTTQPQGPTVSVRLMDGVPEFGTINGTADRTGVRYYFPADFGDQKGTPDVSIEFAGFSGNYRVFVGVDYIPQQNNYTWALIEQEIKLVIMSSDPAYRKKGRYNVLITKAREENPTPHFFSLRVSTRKYTTNIREGRPEIGNMTRDEMRYYKYQVVSTEGTILVAVTPMYGDPDLYISVNSSVHTPSMENNDYVSASLGADIIRIPLAEFYQKNPDCSVRFFDSSSCAIYIAVKCASDECGYSLQAGRSSNMALTLLDGYAQYGAAAGGEPQFYLFTPADVSEPTVVTVYPKKNKAKVYVSIVGPSVQSPNMPTPERHDGSSITRASTEVVTIRPNTLSFCGNQCRIYIGVYVDLADTLPGATPSTEFDIAATSQIRQLTDGQTVVDHVGEKMYKYYKFRVSCSDCVLSISVTPVSGGDPDLYVNKAMMRLPTADHSHFSSLSYMGDFLQITPEDPIVNATAMRMRGPYIIGVYGSQNCTYSLTATTSASVVQNLIQSVPVKQDQPQGKVSYFSFNSWKKEDIKISMRMHSGRAILRANVVNSTREINVLERLPTSEAKSTWSSLRSSTVNSLTISKDDAQFLDQGMYFIAVETEEASMYEITVEYVGGNEYSLLKLAEAYRIHLNSGETKHYSLEIASISNITVRMSLFYGSVEGQISTEKTGEPMWRIIDGSGLLIQASDRNFRLGTYYVTIVGKRETDCTILVEQNMKVMWLSEGLPQRVGISPLSAAYFYYRIPKSNRADEETSFNVYATMRSSNIVNPVMYIRHVTRQDFNQPNMHNADYVVTWDKDLGRLGTSVRLNSSSGSTLAIAVSADLTDGSGPKGEFDIVAWTTGFALIIPDNVYMNKFDKLGDTHVYELVLERSGRVYIEVMPCTGEVEFFVSRSLSGINDRKYDMKKTELSKGKLFGSLDNAAGIYYISVRAVAFSGMSKDAGKGIQYSIKAVVSGEESAENLEDFVPESYGNIDSYVDGEEVTLSWGRVAQRGSAGKKMLNVLYSVYLSEDDKANMYTICGIKYGDADKIASDISAQTLTFSMRGHHGAKKLVFNVIAYIPEYSDTIAYNPLTLQVTRPRPVSRFYARKEPRENSDS